MYVQDEYINDWLANNDKKSLEDYINWFLCLSEVFKEYLDWFCKENKSFNNNQFKDNASDVVFFFIRTSLLRECVFNSLAKYQEENNICEGFSLDELSKKNIIDFQKIDNDLKNGNKEQIEFHIKKIHDLALCINRLCFYYCCTIYKFNPRSELYFSPENNKFVTEAMQSYGMKDRKIDIARFCNNNKENIEVMMRLMEYQVENNLLSDSYSLSSVIDDGLKKKVSPGIEYKNANTTDNTIQK